MDNAYHRVQISTLQITICEVILKIAKICEAIFSENCKAYSVLALLVFDSSKYSNGTNNNMTITLLC